MDMSKRDVETSMGTYTFEQLASDGEHPIQYISRCVITMVTQMLADEGVHVAAGGMRMTMMENDELGMPDDDMAQRLSFDFFITTCHEPEVLNNVRRRGAEMLADDIEQDPYISPEDREEAIAALRDRRRA